jgi:hypothetical protein
MRGNGMHAYEVVKAIDIAIERTKELLAVDDDPLLRPFLIELQRYQRVATDHWPLTPDEKRSVDIGRVAARELDDVYPEYVTLLCNVGAALRQESRGLG